MRRWLAGAMALLVMMSVFHPVAEAHSEPLVTFSVISDIHVRAGKNDAGKPYVDHKAAARFAAALRDLQRVDPNQQALVINGDLTVTGMQSDYDYMNRILRDNPHPKNVLFAIGNHEFYAAFRDARGRQHRRSFPNGETETACIQRFLHNTGMSNVYFERWIAGYPFIVLGSEQSRITRRSIGDQAYLSNAQLTWLQNALNASGGHRPVFVFLHQPLPQTVAGSTGNAIVHAERLQAILRKHPEVVFFSGHSHRTFRNEPRTIFRDGFTMLNTSSVRNPLNRLNLPVGSSEGLYVQVYSHRLVVRERDFLHGVWMNQFTIPTPSPPALGRIRGSRTAFTDLLPSIHPSLTR
ncbi:hypothetical protein GCM10025857_01430 [Alicyclobacillus contaminans]|uniref:metallophosphoesterase family protein n=1 Tax=Alicyclobacillus contaminans TaxID=392016 RepID=UPI00146FB55C|nr:metallophosphoesterase [Alicyclobacillus contaminans]GMA48786.1 hypothetical protein GCM10025857_01430 [Alicyclobacillus contaminans]